jgi:delta-aminolevulinic acid dehydratase/porphobilinogen synthase
MIRNWEKEQALSVKRVVFSIFVENKRENIKH